MTQPTEGNVPVRFRLTPSEQQVQIGHGICSGAFELQEGVRYSVRLVAVDMAGNPEVGAWSQRVQGLLGG